MTTVDSNKWFSHETWNMLLIMLWTAIILILIFMLIYYKYCLKSPSGRNVNYEVVTRNGRNLTVRVNLPPRIQPTSIPLSTSLVLANPQSPPPPPPTSPIIKSFTELS